MSNLYVIFGRGNGKTALRMKIMEALYRANVVQRIDKETNTLHIRSKNLDEPLTDQEKNLITNALSIQMKTYEVVFDN